MKIRTQSNQLIDINRKTITTLYIPSGSYQILAHTRTRKKAPSWENTALKKRLSTF